MRAFSPTDMTSDAIAATVDSARRAAGVSWAEPAELPDGPPVWTVAAAGPAPRPPDQAAAVSDKPGA